MKTNFKNQIINGYSLEELKKIQSETFDLVFADPPYNLKLKGGSAKLNQKFRLEFFSIPQDYLRL